jgi:fatty acid-binding protein DegV
VIDTRTIAGPLASIVLAADRLAKRGASADQVDTLEFLRRGGRIGGAAALVGSVLQIKPILTFADGKVEPFEKERTKKRALTRVLELVHTPTSCRSRNTC